VFVVYHKKSFLQDVVDIVSAILYNAINDGVSAKKEVSLWKW